MGFVATEQVRISELEFQRIAATQKHELPFSSFSQWWLKCLEFSLKTAEKYSITSKNLKNEKLLFFCMS